MKKKESAFNKLFRSELEKLGVTFYRVESHATSPGIPDNHYVMIHRQCSVSGWIEMKSVASLPKKVPYEATQALWLENYWRKGGLSWTVMWVETTQQIIIIPGILSIQASRNLPAVMDLRAAVMVIEFAYAGSASWLKVYDCLAGVVPDSSVPWREIT